LHQRAQGYLYHKCRALCAGRWSGLCYAPRTIRSNGGWLAMSAVPHTWYVTEGMQVVMAQDARRQEQIVGQNGGGVSDQALVVALQAGDRDALSCLYDRYAGLVYTLASSERERVAEQATEAVFVELWRMRNGREVGVPLFPTLLSLTARMLGLRTPFRVLSPFASLPEQVGAVLALASLGQLDLLTIAAALDLAPQQVKVMLRDGLAAVTAS
jgi:hypothetical protein